MAYPMFIFSIVLVNIFIISINATSMDFMKGRDSSGKSFPDGLGVVSPGQSITIECNHKGSISWSRISLDNTIVETLTSNNHIKFKDNKLTIDNITFSDASIYYCEQAGLVYRFYLNVYAITKSRNGSVPTSGVSFDMNGIKFDQLKINDKSSANVSCTCDSGSLKTMVVINWKGGSYTKISDGYSIDSRREGSAQINTLILKKPQNNRTLYGEYICSCNVVTGALKEEKVYLEVLPIFEEHESSVRTTEGKNITLVCKAWGFPQITKPIQWRFQNNSDFRAGIQVLNKSEPGFSELLIPFATQNDRGVYTCHAENSLGENIAGTMVRVKGRYAALWPFIGIIIQVIILATIIIIYEWKKSHKPQENANTKFNFDSKAAEQEAGVAIRSGGEQTDIRQRLMVH